jgi:hypothetical protein
MKNKPLRRQLALTFGHMTPMNKMNLFNQADGKAGLMDVSKEAFWLETIVLVQEPFSNFLSGLFAHLDSALRR